MLRLSIVLLLCVEAESDPAMPSSVRARLADAPKGVSAQSLMPATNSSGEIVRVVMVAPSSPTLTLV